MIPKVLLVHFVRPMCVGIMFRDGFRQAGCEVRVAGPGEDEVYGIQGWADDYVPPDFTLPVEAINVNLVLEQARQNGFNPDVIVAVDQYDFAYTIGEAPPDVPWVYIAVEDFNPEQRSRYEQRRGAVEYHMIAHAFPQLVPPDSEWLAFGFDPFMHSCGRVGLREKLVCQIGSPYDPRPGVWDTLRAAYDGDRNAGGERYRHEAIESASTIFGRAPTYFGMADAYRRSMFALSASNCEFLPMRVPEALGFGCILVSDDVGPVRAVSGDPWPENPEGCWVVHDRTAAGHLEAIERVRREGEGVMLAMQQRAIVRGYSGHMYYHRAQQILARLGLHAPARMVSR